MYVADRHALLGADKHKAASKFKEKLFDLSNQSLFEVCFQHWFVFWQTEKFKNIRISDYINWFGYFHAIPGKRKHPFFVRVFT